MSFSIVIDLEPPTPLFTAPARQVQGLPIVFLLVEDGGNIKIGQVAGLRIVWTRRALQPLSQLLLGTILAKIMKEGPSLFITMFIFKDRRHSLAAEADTIPQVGISGIAFEAPDEHSGWYMAHIFAPDFLADLSSMEDHAPHNKDSGGRFMYRRCRGIAGGPSISEPETGVPANGDNDHALPAPASTPQATPGNPPGPRVDRPLMWTTPREMWTTLRPLWTKRRSRRGCGVLQSWNWPSRLHIPAGADLSGAQTGAHRAPAGPLLIPGRPAGAGAVVRDRLSRLQTHRLFRGAAAPAAGPGPVLARWGATRIPSAKDFSRLCL